MQPVMVPVMVFPQAPPKRPNNEEEISNTPRKKPRISGGKVDGFVGKFLDVSERGNPFLRFPLSPKAGIHREEKE